MAQLQCYNVGDGGWPVVVIDDFHDAPMDLLDNAGEFSKFKSYENDFYPGVKRAVDNDQYAKNFQRHADALANTFGKLEVLQESTYAIANTAPADLLPIQRVPHYDTADTLQLALVHYLCASDHGGTGFYRHRSTNIERISPDSVRTYQQAIGREATTHGLPPAQYINGDTDLFKRIGMVDAKFNRAVIYPASLLHSGLIKRHEVRRQIDGLNPATLRLTITANLMRAPETT